MQEKKYIFYTMPLVFRFSVFWEGFERMGFKMCFCWEGKGSQAPGNEPPSGKSLRTFLGQELAS